MNALFISGKKKLFNFDEIRIVCYSINIIDLNKQMKN